MTSKSNMDSNLALFLVVIFTYNIANIRAQHCTQGVTTCSEDCRSILYCADSSRPPRQDDCPPNRFCVAGPAPNTAACTSDYPLCASGSVACSAKGIFPHPLWTSVKIVCPPPPAGQTGAYDPDEICYCSAGENLDPSYPGLPCSATLANPYNLVNCGTQTSGRFTDPNGGELNYVYQCLIDGRITVYYYQPPQQLTYPVPYVESCAAPNQQPPASDNGNNNDNNNDNGGSLICTYQGERFPDSNDCYFYYECEAATGTPIRKPCVGGQIYHESSKVCGPGSC